MNVEQTVRNSIECFPSLFQTGGDVLYYLFCVIGNGHEWVDGELVSVFPADEKWTPQKSWDSFDRMYGDAGEYIRNLMLNHVEEEIAEAQATVDAVDERWDDMTLERAFSPSSPFYPQSHYATLMNLPENIKDDWKQAAEWAKKLATDNGWVFDK